MAQPGRHKVITAMAGLPGTGRSTLARALADQLAGGVLNRDYLRDHLFPPNLVDQSAEQDDFCFEVMLKTTAWLLERDPAATIILDGLTFTRTHQVSALQSFADHLGQGLRIIECICAERLALTRLAANRAAGRHGAPHRDAELYYTLKEKAEPVPQPKLVIDTAQPVEACTALALRFVTPRPATTRPRAPAHPRPRAQPGGGNGELPAELAEAASAGC